MLIWMILIIIIIVAAAVVLATMFYDSRRFVIRKYRLFCKGLKREYRFVMLSDLHNKQFGEKNSRLLAAVDELKPESILVAGDMLTSEPVCFREDDQENEKAAEHFVKPAQDFMCALGSKYPVYYANGNHEYRLKTQPEDYIGDYQAYKKELTENGVIFLENGSVKLPEIGVRIYGVEIEREFYKKMKKTKMDQDYLASLIGRPDPDSFHILLAHNPDYFPRYAEWGADLVLSGHVHGGIMKLPLLGGVISPSLRLFPKYDGGLFEERNSRMILGR